LALGRAARQKRMGIKSMKMVLPAILFAFFLPFQALSKSQDNSAVEVAVVMICKKESAKTEDQKYLNQLKISPMELCECIKKETSYAMLGTNELNIVSAYIVRMLLIADSAYQNETEKLAWSKFIERYNVSRENCIHRLAIE
jgi:hypothetical protein